MPMGQVICTYGQTCDVETPEGHRYVCFARKSLAHPLVVGDQVDFTIDPQTQQGVVTTCLPRRSFFARRDRHHPLKAIAANLSQIVILFAPLPAPNEYYLDRYLAAAELAGLPVSLILNKSDLLSLDSPACDLAALYEDIGYAVFRLSALNKTGLETLLPLLENQTTLLLGPSGVGKSSLINALMQDASLTKTQPISTATQKGQHTTSTGTLYHLDPNSHLIDIAGIREFHPPLDHLSHLIDGFREFRPYLGRCQFRNCDHRPPADHCALLQAVSKGELNATRLQNYYRILDTTLF